jgi:hypothetical protein
LAAVGQEAASLRRTLAVLDQQLAFADSVAAEAGTQALVGGTPLDQRERRRAEGDAQRLGRESAEVRARLAALAAESDALLERLFTVTDAQGG